MWLDHLLSKREPVPGPRQPTGKAGNGPLGTAWLLNSEVKEQLTVHSRQFTVKRRPREIAAFLLCAEHVRQLEGESPFDNLMEVKS